MRLASSGRSKISNRFSIGSFDEKPLQIRTELRAEDGMFECVVNRGFQIANLLAGVIAPSFEYVAIEIAAGNELAQGVCKLDLAASAAFGGPEVRKDVRGEDVAANDGVAGRRIRLRLL